MKRLVIGILAHVDSGKTTLSEGMLYLSGNIRKLGRVDHGDAFLDTYSLERERGITIFSKQAVLKTLDSEITLLDTPGHVDFSPEAERTLQVLDAAILVISGTDGVQSHTETLWKLLSKYSIPTFIFINKMDMPGADRETLMTGLHRRLSDRCFFADSLNDFENLSMCDEALMEKYLTDGSLTDEDVKIAVLHRKLFLCSFGSALKLDGVSEFLSILEKYTQEPRRSENFGARVYKISRDELGARLVHMKITSGSLKVKSVISYTDDDGEKHEEKVDRIRIFSGNKSTGVDEAFSGQVCAVTGLTKLLSGDGIGNEKGKPSMVLQPVLSYSVILPAGLDAHTALSKLKSLEDEEPQLNISWNEQLKEIHVLLMGEVQLDVLKRIASERFGFDIAFGKGAVVYKETIEDTVEGVGHYEPLRHYAEVHLLLEKGEKGSGLEFKTDCDANSLERNWQNLILTHLEERHHVGVLTGSPITDMKITLVSGRASKKHTEGGDFREATYRAVRQGLRKAKSVLLEPWYDFEIYVPTECVGRAMNDIQMMGGTLGIPESDGDESVIKGSAPVSEMRGYSLDIAAYTHGKGRLVCTLHGYERCHDQDRIISEIGYSADSDINNSADSIFCAGGAGFMVRWDEVEKHMHLESVLKEQDENAEEKLLFRQRAADYCARVATDKELMAIFERTYGPIKKRDNSKPKLNPSAGGVPAKPKPVKKEIKSYDGEEYLLVDGYNIIFAWDELKASAEKSLDMARNDLINRLCNYQGFCQNRIILVFDAYKVKKSPGSVEKFRNISVVYTKEAETADTYIERVSHELSKKHKVRVATSDGSEQMIILGNGSLRIPAGAFHKEIRDAEKEIESYFSN